MRSKATVTAVLVAAAGVAGCSSGAGPAGASGSSGASTSTQQPSPAITATSVPSSATPTGTAVPSASVTSSPSRAVARWPKPLGAPREGDPVWGVYLAVGHSTSDAVIAAAQQQAAGVGYQAIVGDLACDRGAVEALGLDQYDYWTTASLYFANEADARAFASAYTAKVAKPRGLAAVKIGCLD